MPGILPSFGFLTKRFVATRVAKEFETTRLAFRNTIKEIKEMAQEAGTWRTSGVTGSQTSRSDSKPTSGAGATSRQKASCGDAPSSMRNASSLGFNSSEDRLGSNEIKAGVHGAPRMQRTTDPENDRLTRLATRIRRGLTLETTFELTGDPKSDIRTMLLGGPELKEALTPPQASRRGWRDQVALLERYVFWLGLALDNGCISALDANNVVFGVGRRAVRVDTIDTCDAPGSVVDLGTSSIARLLLSDEIVTVAPSDPECTAALAVSFVGTLKALYRAGGDAPQKLRSARVDRVAPPSRFVTQSSFEQLGCTTEDPGIHIWMHECLSEALRAMGCDLLILRDPEDPAAFQWQLMASEEALASSEVKPLMSGTTQIITAVARKLADESRQRMANVLESLDYDAKAFVVPPPKLSGVQPHAAFDEPVQDGSATFRAPREKRGFGARIRNMWARVSGFVKEAVVKPLIEYWRGLFAGKTSAARKR